MDAHCSFGVKGYSPPQKAQKQPRHPSSPPSLPPGEGPSQGCTAGPGCPGMTPVTAPSSLHTHPVRKHSRGPAHHEPHLLAAASSPSGSPKPQLLCGDAGGGWGPTALQVGLKHPKEHGATLRSVTIGAVAAQPLYRHTSAAPAHPCKVLGHQAWPRTGNLQPLWRVSSHLLPAGE